MISLSPLSLPDTQCSESTAERLGTNCAPCVIGESIHDPKTPVWTKRANAGSEVGSLAWPEKSLKIKALCRENAACRQNGLPDKPLEPSLADFLLVTAEPYR